MTRGWCFPAVLAVVVSCFTSAVYAQNPAVQSGVAAAPIAPSPGALPPAEAVAAPAAVPAAAAPADSPATGLSADPPWFQRFVLPVPEARETIDDWPSCYSPGVMVNADYLNWSARRSGLDFASFVSATNPAAAPTATDSLDFDRANGVRAGLGYRFGNGWNVAWTYTYFRTASEAVVSANLAADPKLIATQSYLDTGLLTKVAMSSVEADGALQVNVQDFEAQWSSCLNDTVGFKAFGGFRWAKIDQTFNMSYAYAAGTGSINLPNDMDAEGLRLGAEFQWRSSCGLCVFGRGAQSILVADFRTRQHEVAPASAVDINVPGQTTAVIPVVEAAAGVAYACGPWEFSTGYEMSDWFNMVQVNRTAQSLLLDGYFLRLAFLR